MFNLFNKNVQVIIVEENTVERLLVVEISTNTRTIKELKKIVSKTISLENRSLKYKFDSEEFCLSKDIDVETMITKFRGSAKIEHKLICYKSFRPSISSKEKAEKLKKKLAEKYNVDQNSISLLGKGGFGFVFGLPPIENSIPIAVKVLIDDNGNDLLNEVKTTLSMNHPHIVEAGNFFTLNNVSYFKSVVCYEMERMLGTLKNFFLDDDGKKKLRNITEHIAVMIINQVSQAFQACVDRKVCHRDVKPDNILVKSISDDSIHVVLSDFGSAFTSSKFNRQVNIEMEGTVRYLAPEVVEDCKNFSIQSDIFSLGITLYYLMIGRFGATGEILCEKPEQVERHLVELSISPFVSQLILGMIKKDPAQRMSLNVLLQLTNDYLNTKKQLFTLQADGEAYRIELPFYPKYDELVKLIEKKLGHNDFNLTHNQEIVTNDSECYQMITSLLSKDPKQRVITLKLSPINEVLQNASKNYENGNYEIALKFCDQYLKRSSASLTILTKAANCCFYLKNYEKAIEYFSKAYSVKEWKSRLDVKFYERFAYCYFNIRKYENAYSLYEKALSKENYKTFYLAGLCALKTNLFERSVALLSKSYSLKRNIEAIDAIVQVLQQLSSPLNIYSWTDEGIALFAHGIYMKKLNELDESRKLLERALDKLPNDDEFIVEALRSIQP
ncbi:serine/threonine protein kinase [Naegleria gruberi]|uniref:Serine/threonine protein kinase n=1 Tax=Naegleria gruberi TaxID=5762 RepID=D2VDN5_NAEGR|nr:serine/threonine protein kinase [Naegleria gruberi]EFC45032.1 serine/threonine protein kinase [Naegleria gruberi]|eukprot:XP_002677776.1 serine/threonine protein kinase [Naegleria gruberi strain NEG-M]